MSGLAPVAVGLSGGVDSSVAIALLKQQGHPVVGITLWLMRGKGQCCSEGLVDAARLCEELGVPHYIVDSREIFEKYIVDYLVTGYANGITPLPCSQCNRMVKFGPMLAYSRAELGIDTIATGHYAQVKYNSASNRYELWRALDRHKDQTYFLYDLPQEILAHVLFPLGTQTKDQTRALAAQYGLHTATKPDSQDLCLIEAYGSMRQFLEQHLPPTPGEVVDTSGRVLGYHQGIHNYTIGQRKGLGIAAAEPLYVVALDRAHNRVIVGNRASAARSECTVARVNWVSIDPPQHPLTLEVQIRYRTPPVPVTVLPTADPEQVKLVFAEPQFGVTPGQAAVWYEGDRLIGGGIIQPFSAE